jgi:hypothetical protein
MLMMSVPSATLCVQERSAHSMHRKKARAHGPVVIGQRTLAFRERFTGAGHWH